MAQHHIYRPAHLMSPLSRGLEPARDQSSLAGSSLRIQMPPRSRFFAPEELRVSHHLYGSSFVATPTTNSWFTRSSNPKLTHFEERKTPKGSLRRKLLWVMTSCAVLRGCISVVPFISRTRKDTPETEVKVSNRCWEVLRYLTSWLFKSTRKKRFGSSNAINNGTQVNQSNFPTWMQTASKKVNSPRPSKKTVSTGT